MLNFSETVGHFSDASSGLDSCSQNSQKKPTVIILATGGTIAGAAGSGVQSGYTSGQVTIDAMINAVPDITKLATIKGEQVSNVGSQDMSFLRSCCALPKLISELAKKGDMATGVVITHGTDTMEETAYFSQPGVQNGYADRPGRVHAALDGCQRRWSAEFI